MKMCHHLAMNAVVSGPRPEDQAARGRLGLFVAIAIALSIQLGATIAIPDYLPTNDGPEHLFGSHAVRRLDDSSLGYGHFLKPGFALSQIGFDQLFGLFDAFLPWRNALRATLIVMVLLWAWGVVAMAAAMGGRRRIWLGLFGFAGAIQWQLYMGLFPFYLATGLGFYVLALAVWRAKWSPLWRVLLAAMLTSQALIHPFAAMCTGLCLVLIRAWDTKIPRLPREVAWLVLMGLPAAMVANTGRGIPVVAETLFLPWTERFSSAVTAFVSGPRWRSLPLPLCALAGAAWAAIGKEWRNDRRSAALLTAGLLFAVLATQAPRDLAAWQFFAMRFSPVAAVLLLVLLPVERWPKTARMVGLVLLVSFAIGSNAWALAYNTNLRRQSDDLLSGLQAPIRRHGIRLPLIIEPLAGEPQQKRARTIPYDTPNWNIGSIYAIEQGGVPAWTFADNEQLHTVVWRWPEQQGPRPPRPERGFEWALSEPEILSVPGARKAAVQRLLSYAPYYEDVIFYGRPDEVQWLHDRQFIIDYERGGLAIARFRPCPAQVDLYPSALGHSRTVAYFGWAPASEPTFSTVLPAVGDGQSARAWPIQECPCGEVWFRILFDNDGDGRASAGDTTCLEANAQGLVSANVLEGGVRLSCHPGRPLSFH